MWSVPCALTILQGGLLGAIGEFFEAVSVRRGFLQSGVVFVKCECPGVFASSFYMLKFTAPFPQMLYLISEPLILITLVGIYHLVSS